MVSFPRRCKNLNSLRILMTKPKPFNFAKAVQQLEEITRWLQDHDLDLEQGLQKVKEGKKIVDECKKNLDTIENEFIEVKKEFDSGLEQTTPQSTVISEPEEAVEETRVVASKKRIKRTPARVNDEGFIPLKSSDTSNAEVLDDDDDLPF